MFSTEFVDNNLLGKTIIVLSAVLIFVDLMPISSTVPRPSEVFRKSPTLNGFL